jgi:hypothetical protein
MMVDALPLKRDESPAWSASYWGWLLSLFSFCDLAQPSLM